MSKRIKVPKSTLFFIVLLIGVQSCFQNATEGDNPANTEISGSTATTNAFSSREYCVNLDSMQTRGGWAACTEFGVCSSWLGTSDYEPRLYGRVCAISSENPKLLDNNLSLNDKLADCKDLWFVKDDNPLASSSFVWIADAFTSMFSGDAMQQLMTMYRGSNPGEIRRGTTHILKTKQTIKLEDYLNNKILLIFLPILKDDNVTDDLLADSKKILTESDVQKHYPVISDISDSQIPSIGEYSTMRRFLRDGRSGQVDFNFTISRNACP